MFALYLLRCREFDCGLHVKQHPKAKLTTISQEKYIDGILARFNMTACNDAATPMASSFSLARSIEGSNETLADEKEYQQIVGSLMYAMLGSRPDLSYAVGVVEDPLICLRIDI